MCTVSIGVQHDQYALMIHIGYERKQRNVVEFFKKSCGTPSWYFDPYFNRKWNFDLNRSFKFILPDSILIGSIFTSRRRRLNSNFLNEKYISTCSKSVSHLKKMNTWICSLTLDRCNRYNTVFLLDYHSLMVKIATANHRSLREIDSSLAVVERPAAA